jgi:hypothetical protein
MRPSKKHMKVERYVEPAEFAKWKQVAEDMGFLYVASGPLVRSSYKVSFSLLLLQLSFLLHVVGFVAQLIPSCLLVQAGEFFLEGILKRRREVILYSACPSLNASCTHICSHLLSTSRRTLD